MTRSMSQVLQRSKDLTEPPPPTRCHSFLTKMRLMCYERCSRFHTFWGPQETEWPAVRIAAPVFPATPGQQGRRRCQISPNPAKSCCYLLPRMSATPLEPVKVIKPDEHPGPDWDAARNQQKVSGTPEPQGRFWLRCIPAPKPGS